MYKSHIMIVMLYFCFLSATMTQAQKGSGSDFNKESSTVTMTLMSLSVTDKTLEIGYQINNDSKQDIWICEGINHNYWNFEVGMAQDGPTLLIRRRLNVPMFGFGELPFGHYVRLRKNEIRKESLLLTLPVRPYHIFLGGRPLSKVIEHAKSLVFETGFYSGDMPKMIFDLLEEAEKIPKKKHVEDNGYPIDASGWLGGLLYFNEINERVENRDEQVVIPWTNQTLKGEQVIRAAADMNIPYIEYRLGIEFTQPILYSCTKIKIEYRPSMLDYFFSDSDQKLMSNTEINYLQSQKTVVVDDKRLIGAMKDEIDQAYRVSKIVTESKSACITCYHGDEQLTFFTVYGKESILTEDNQCLWHQGSLQSLKMFTEQIKPFELRIQCAANIKNLWYRLRLYHIAGEELKVSGTF